MTAPTTKPKPKPEPEPVPDYLVNHYAPIEGGTIERIEFARDPMDADLWPVLIVRNGPNRYRVELSRDPEGNGPGHAFISEDK